MSRKDLDEIDEATLKAKAVGSAAVVGSHSVNGVVAKRTPDVDETDNALAETSDDHGEQSSDFFVSQLKDLAESIATSFDGIAGSMEELRVKVSTLTTLCASLSGVVGPSTSFSDKDIDSRLMYLEVAQRAQNDLNKAEAAANSTVTSAGQPGDPADSLAGFAQPPDHHMDAVIQRRIQMIASGMDFGEIELNPRAKSVFDIWDEWMHGYKGQRPLQTLETRYGTKWRRGRIAKSAQRRKKVIEFIQAEHKRVPHKKWEEIVAALEEYRRRHNKGLFWLYGSLPPRLFDEDGDLAKDVDVDDDDVDKDLGDAVKAVQVATKDDTTDPALAGIDKA